MPALGTRRLIPRLWLVLRRLALGLAVAAVALGAVTLGHADIGWRSALVIGLVFGIVFAAIGYAFTRGRRDFSSATTIVAGRYDILCEPSSAPRARDMIAEMGPRPAQSLIDESPQS